MSGCTLCAGIDAGTLDEFGGCQGCGRAAPREPVPPQDESPLAAAVREARSPDPVAFIEAWNRARRESA